MLDAGRGVVDFTESDHWHLMVVRRHHAKTWAQYRRREREGRLCEGRDAPYVQGQPW